MIERDLNTDEAKTQMKGVINEIEICICCLDEREFPLKVHPLGISKMDDEANFWFIYNKGKYANLQIGNGNHLELIYSEPGQAHLLTVYGIAAVVDDRHKLEEVWTGIGNELFEQGINDPNIVLLKIAPTEAYYNGGANFGHFVIHGNRSKAA